MKILQKAKIFVLFLLTLLAVNSGNFALAGGAHGKSPEGEKFDAGKMILEHVADAYDWHLWGHSSIPLPIIAYSTERGLDIFLSSKFDHGHKTYNGYAIHDNHLVAVNEMGSVDAHSATVNEDVTAGIWDISIKKNVASLFITLILLCLIFISVAKSYKKNVGKAPSGLQSFMEPLILFVRDEIAIPSIGEHKYHKFMPFLLTIFFFIWISNIMGLIPVFPGGANLTGNIAVAGVLAVFTFVITTFVANKNYWRHIFAMPGVPAGVLFILTPIEILGVFLRPFVLMIRLFANITAGHIIVLSFFSLIFIFGEMSSGLGYGVSILSLAFTIFMSMLELLVAFLQAYVFTFLSAIYFGSAIEEAH